MAASRSAGPGGGGNLSVGVGKGDRPVSMMVSMKMICKVWLVPLVDSEVEGCVSDKELEPSVQ